MTDVVSANNPFPHGTVSLQGDLVGAQDYDIKLELELPRTRANREVVVRCGFPQLWAIEDW